jgi:hypothetical protein
MALLGEGRNFRRWAYLEACHWRHAFKGCISCSVPSSFSLLPSHQEVSSFAPCNVVPALRPKATRPRDGVLKPLKAWAKRHLTSSCLSQLTSQQPRLRCTEWSSLLENLVWLEPSIFGEVIRVRATQAEASLIHSTNTYWAPAMLQTEQSMRQTTVVPAHWRHTYHEGHRKETIECRLMRCLWKLCAGLGFFCSRKLGTTERFFKTFLLACINLWNNVFRARCDDAYL